MFEYKKERLIRELNQSRRAMQKQFLNFSEIGSVTNVFKSKDEHGTPDKRKKVSLGDKLVIFFNSGNKNFRGIINFKDLYKCGFYPKHGQRYKFHSKTERREYNGYTLVHLNSITSE